MHNLIYYYVTDEVNNGVLTIKYLNMASNSETGHANNVANFDELITFVDGYGKEYNPTKSSIILKALQTKSDNAKMAMNAVNSSVANCKNAIAAREEAFVPLSKIATRIVNALKATDTTTQVDENVKSIARKIQGKRATPKMTAEEKQSAEASGQKVTEISTSQMGYDNRIENFNKLVILLKTIPEYKPNEEDLKIAALTKTVNDLKALNAAVVKAMAALSNDRIARDEELYKADTGLCDTSLAVKGYVKSVFGAVSHQYKQISGLKFKKGR